MLGQKIQPNGMTVMVMAEGTTPLAQPLMFAHPNPEPLLAKLGGDRWGCPDTDGDGWSNLVMRSFMNQHNGEIRTATVTVTKPMEMRQMHVQRSANFNPDRLGCRDTDGDGSLIQPMAGTLIRTVQRMPSRPKPCNGRTAMVMDLVMHLGALRDDCPEAFGTSRETYKVRGQQRRWLVE